MLWQSTLGSWAFNIPKELNKIPTLKCTVYADDITLWVQGGSDARIEHTLQNGAQAVLKAANEVRLSCPFSKSELLLLPPKRKKERTHLHRFRSTFDNIKCP